MTNQAETVPQKVFLSDKIDLFASKKLLIPRHSIEEQQLNTDLFMRLTNNLFHCCLLGYCSGQVTAAFLLGMASPVVELIKSYGESQQLIKTRKQPTL